MTFLDREGEEAWFGFGEKVLKLSFFFLLFWNSRGLVWRLACFFECKMKYYVTFGVFLVRTYFFGRHQPKHNGSRGHIFLAACLLLGKKFSAYR